MTDRKLIIGIDPSFVNTGVCIYNPRTKHMMLKTSDMMEMVKWITTTLKESNFTLRDVLVVIENPALDSTTFNMWGMVQSVIQDYVHNLIVKMGVKGRFVGVLQWAGFTKKRALAPVTALKMDGSGAHRSPVSIHSVRSKFSIAMNYAQKVGENKAAAKLFIQMLAKKNVPILEIAPSKREKGYKDRFGKKIYSKTPELLKMPTKTNAEQFQQLTGYTGRSNEHNRDAATLVYGKTIANVGMLIQIQEAERGKQPASYPSSKNNNEFIFNGSTKPF